MEMKDAGQTYPAPTVATEKTEVCYPSLSVDLAKFPELEGDLNEEIGMVIVGKVRSKNLSEYGKTQCFDIVKIGAPGVSAPEKPKNEADKIVDYLSSMNTR
jgi:hypothetical protein